MSLAQLTIALRSAVQTLRQTLLGHVAARTTSLSYHVDQAARLEASVLRMFAFDIIENPHVGGDDDSYASMPFVVDDAIKKTLESMITNCEIGAALLFEGESFANNTHPSEDLKANLLVYWSLCSQFSPIARSLWENCLKSTIHDEVGKRGIEMFVKEPYVFDNSRWMTGLINMELFWPIRDCLGTSVLHVILQELGRKRSKGSAYEPAGLAKKIASQSSRPFGAIGNPHCSAA